MNNHDQLRVIVFQEASLFVAQCLEHDIATQAASLDDVLTRLDLTIEAEMAMRGSEDLSGISPAPNYYQSLWDKQSLKIERVARPLPGALKLDVVYLQAA